jgi:GxxExxY protein
MAAIPMDTSGGIIAIKAHMEQRGERGLAHSAVTGQILKSFFEVYRELGYGFSEGVYRRALAIDVGASGLKVLEEVPLDVYYRGVLVGRFRADMIVAGVVLVETKAAAVLEDYAQAQLLNYLKAAGGGVGMLLNFGREPTFRRLVLGTAGEGSLPRARDRREGVRGPG